MLWEQKLDDIRYYVQRLERDLAEVDALVAAHAEKIDGNPRIDWPSGSILAKATERHARRVAEETAALSRS
jgi:hypothetical protein